MNFSANWIWRLLAAVLGFSAAASYSVAQAETQSALKLSDGFPDAARQLVRPFPQFSNVTWINPSIGNSTYHAGFVRAEKRISGGLSFLAHYTFSKFLDDVEASQEFGSTGSYMDAYNRRLDKGLSGSDVPHGLAVTLLHEVPRFKSNRVVNGAAGRPVCSKPPNPARRSP